MERISMATRIKKISDLKKELLYVLLEIIIIFLCKCASDGFFRLGFCCVFAYMVISFAMNERIKTEAKLTIFTKRFWLIMLAMIPFSFLLVISQATLVTSILMVIVYLALKVFRILIAFKKDYIG